MWHECRRVIGASSMAKGRREIGLEGGGEIVIPVPKGSTEIATSLPISPESRSPCRSCVCLCVCVSYWRHGGAGGSGGVGSNRCVRGHALVGVCGQQHVTSCACAAASLAPRAAASVRRPRVTLHLMSWLQPQPYPPTRLKCGERIRLGGGHRISPPAPSL